MGLVGIIQHHGYLLTGLMVFLSGMGLPLPVSAVLLLAGAATHLGLLHLYFMLPLAWLAASAGDTVLYLGGRYTGWWLLGMLCRMSMNPENCIFGTADYFYRRGPRTLLFAKFVPGLGLMAPPMAGSLNMPLPRFLRMDATGALAYCTMWTMIGFAFSKWIKDIVAAVENAGHVAVICVALLVAAYGLTMAVVSVRDRRYRRIPRVSAEELKQRMESRDPNRLVIIADVRSHGYYDAGGQRIKNSIRVEPARLKDELLALREFMAPECEVYLYCSCIRDATSARIAHMLQQENCKTHVIEGGLRAWIKAGGPLEPIPATDVEHLPRFT
jgi:membrane protein DedA with SNARE-associated domain/rhodanese-related sulfurtransferase